MDGCVCVYLCMYVVIFCHLQAIPFDLLLLESHSVALWLHDYIRRSTCSCVEIHAEISCALIKLTIKKCLLLLLLFIKMIMSIFAYSIRSSDGQHIVYFLHSSNRTHFPYQCFCASKKFGVPDNTMNKCHLVGISVSPCKCIVCVLVILLRIPLHFIAFHFFIWSHRNITTNEIKQHCCWLTKWLLHDILMIRDARVHHASTFRAEVINTLPAIVLDNILYSMEMLCCIQFSLEKWNNPFFSRAC